MSESDVTKFCIEWIETHPELANEYRKAKRKEYAKQYYKQYYQLHKGQLNAKSKAWNTQHPEWGKQYGKQWRKEHPDYNKQWCQQRKQDEQ